MVSKFYALQFLSTLVRILRKNLKKWVFPKLILLRSPLQAFLNIELSSVANRSTCPRHSSCPCFMRQVFEITTFTTFYVFRFLLDAKENVQKTYLYKIKFKFFKI